MTYLLFSIEISLNGSNDLHKRSLKFFLDLGIKLITNSTRHGFCVNNKAYMVICCKRYVSRNCCYHT